MLNKILFTFLVFFQTAAYANQYIAPIPLEGQKEIYINGGIVMRSEKKIAMELYQTKSEIHNGRCSFYFAVANNSDRLITIHPYQLMVTDQNGSPIRVVSKAELINDKSNSAMWKQVFSSIAGFFEYCAADDAGEVTCHSVSTSHYNYDYDHVSGKLRSRGRGNANAVVTTRECIYSEALRQQAIQQAEINAAVRSDSIQQEYEEAAFALKHFYFDSNTIFPNTIYGANFQIDAPRCLEKRMQYLFITLTIEDENHTFCFQCCPK